MALAAFDTLQIFEDLEKAGFEESKAKAISAVVRRAHESSDFATKRDIDDLRKDMDAKHESLRKDMAAMEERFNARLDKLTLQLAFRLGGVMVATLTILSLLPKIFH
jgi:hypothetical protein